MTVPSRTSPIDGSVFATRETLAGDTGRGVALSMIGIKPSPIRNPTS